MTDAERLAAFRSVVELGGAMELNESAVKFLLTQLDAAHKAMETARDAIATQTLIKGSKIAYETLDKALGGGTE